MRTLSGNMRRPRSDRKPWKMTLERCGPFGHQVEGEEVDPARPARRLACAHPGKR